GERRILLENALVQVAEGGARLDAELVDEHPPRGGERLERFCLAPRAIEGEHQLAAQTFSQGGLREELFEHRDQLVMPAEREPRIDLVLARGDPQLLEATRRLLREGLVPDVRERGPAPERQRLLERAVSFRQPLRGQLVAPARDQLLE